MSEQSSNGQAIEVPAAASALYQPPQSAIANANVANYLELRHEALADIGVDAVFNSRSRLDDIVRYIEENVARWPRN